MDAAERFALARGAFMAAVDVWMGDCTVSPDVRANTLRAVASTLNDRARVSPAVLDEIKRLWLDEVPSREIAQRVGLPKRTVCRYAAAMPELPKRVFGGWTIVWTEQRKAVLRDAAMTGKTVREALPLINALPGRLTTATGVYKQAKAMGVRLRRSEPAWVPAMRAAIVVRPVVTCVPPPPQPSKRPFSMLGGRMR